MELKRPRSRVPLASDEKGQAAVEYVLLLFIIVMAFIGVAAFLSDSRLSSRIMKPIKEDYARAYRYGHVKAKGYEDGGPEYHPRIVDDGGENNFRIFITLEE